MLQQAQDYYTQQHKAFSDDFRLRVYRCLSWLHKADTVNDDLDSQFIYLWIAFNAAYARDFGYHTTGDKDSFKRFINTLCRLDKQKHIYQLIWEGYAGSIRIILDNQYVFQPFWDYHNQKISENAWQEDFAKAKKKVKRGLENQDTEQILRVLFNRFYTLRNQIFHGGATFASSVNRKQLTDATNILSSILPMMLIIMQQNHQQTDWGMPFYPVID